jgi:hypothetical protein
VEVGVVTVGAVAVVEVVGATVVVVVEVAGAVAVVLEVGAVVVVVLVVGQGGYIPPHNCANAEVERAADKNIRKASLGKENLNIASNSFQPFG